MEQSIKIESMFDGRSHHGSFRQHLWYRWRRWLILRRFVCIAMVIIGGVIAFKTNGSGDKWANFISISFILIGSVSYIRPMIWQMWNERKLRKHPAYGTKITYTFNAEEIIMDGASGKVVVPWCALSEVVETKLGMLLYQNKKDYLWIPGYDFKAGEMGEIVRLHQAAI